MIRKLTIVIFVLTMFLLISLYSVYASWDPDPVDCCGKEEPGGDVPPYEPPTTTTVPPPYCGDGSVNSGEQCELPNTNNNSYCSQTTSACSGNKTGTRDSYGNCNSGCSCVYDSFTYSCVKNSCSAECSANSDCPSKCVGSVRYYSGDCGSTSCACTYTTENCDDRDGWYNTSTKQWVDFTICKEKEQQKRENRDYSCEPAGCTYTVIETEWVDTGRTRNKPDGTACGTNSTSCPSAVCVQLNYTSYVYAPCTRECEDGACGNCNSCTFDSEICEPLGCCDAACDVSSGCGLEQNDNNCENYCAGSRRYYSGTCGVGCGCSYLSENCNDNDGWYNTSTTQWINLDVCREKEQLKQEYRDYFCEPEGCDYTVTKYQWVDTGKTRNKADGTVCGLNTTSCRGDYCTNMTFYEWDYSPCDRVCAGGVCGTCNTCSLTSTVCTAQGCCDTTCNNLKGCGLKKNNANCPQYCIGNVRYFSGSCGADCFCSYSSQNCDSSDGWYNTTEKRWVNCEDDKCELCEQVKQEYKDYYCLASGCQYNITDYKWIFTGKRKVLVCPRGTYCLDGDCIPPPTCEETANVRISSELQICPNEYFYVYANDLNFCERKRVEFHFDSCDGELIGRCNVKDGTCKVRVRLEHLGTPTIVACVDKNGDKDFADAGEQDSIVLSVDCHNCESSYKCKMGKCDWCAMCGGDCHHNVNPWIKNICLNPGEECSYSCAVGYCDRTTCE